MARIMFWPDVYKERGHWLPCINLANSLKDAGHDVEFMGIPDTASIVSPYDATFTEVFADIYVPGHSIENTLEPIDQRWKPHHILPMARGELDGIFQTNPPDLLVSGYFTALETLILHRKYGIKFVTITTYLRHPQEDVASRARTQLYYMSKPLVQKIIGLTTGDPDMDIEAFVAPLEDATELIPCPQEFDFDDGDWKHRADTHYVEPMIERTALGPSPPSADPIVVPEGKQLIFATAGSMVQDYEFRARDFFRALVGMMGTQDADAYYLVIAAGDRLSGELNREFTNKLKNTLITPWVSQLDVLPDAVAVFMHGGLATIKESIWEEVPIVIVPHGKDQIDNALRIRRSGVGMVSEVDQITPQALRRFLTEATTSSWVKLSLAKMRGIFEAAETSKPSVGIINGVLAS